MVPTDKHERSDFSGDFIGLLVAALLWFACGPAAANEQYANHDEQLGLPVVLFPADNPQTPEKIRLGRALFNDARLSADGHVSCAACHRPELAHSDGLSVAEGVNGSKGVRNAPSILNAAYLTSLFWDGRRKSLEEQARDPLMNPLEHGLKNEDTLLEKVRSRPEYQVAFEQAFGVHGNAISMDLVTKAIAAFERTLVAGNSPFDRYYYGGDKEALTQDATRGLSLFTGRAGCVKCHTIGPASALFTDQEFHSIGVGFKRIESRLAEIAKAALAGDERAGGQTAVSSADIAELGRFVVTKRPEDIGKFRTPSLRNVAVTAPYMHDGSVPTLEVAVDLELYYRGIESGRPLILTPLEKADLVSFLKALTSPQFLPPKPQAPP